MLMKILQCVVSIAAVIDVFVVTDGIRVRLKKRSTIYLPYSYQSGQPHYELKKVAAEQLAYDPSTKILYTVGDLVLHAIDVTDPDNMVILSYLEYPGMEFTDVEYCGGHVFTALDNRTDRANGKVLVFTEYNKTTNRMTEIINTRVGAIPDMVKPTSDCKKLVVAVEAEAYETPTGITDPPGMVVILNWPWGIGGIMPVSQLHFQDFDNRLGPLLETGVRHVYQENNNPFSNDVEPEYIAINSNDTIAYVVLQENNAVAEVNLLTQTIHHIYGLGFKDWQKSAFDPSDRDSGYNLNNYQAVGMYQPDSIAHFQYNGEEYLVMANEGDAKDYDFSNYEWTEDVRAKNVPLEDFWHLDLITRNQLRNDTYLGRLKLSTSPTGRNTHPGDNSFREVYSYGARSWSIRRADDLSLVYDSGSDISEWTYSQHHDLFNCEIDKVTDEPQDSFDKRSDNKGPETEDVAVGVVDGVTLIFVANERPGTIMVYSTEDGLTTPHFQDFYTGIPQTRGKTWQQMYEEEVLSELDCEDMKFYPASDSPTGKPVLFAAGSVSGTVSIIDVEIS